MNAKKIKKMLKVRNNGKSFAYLIKQFIMIGLIIWIILSIGYYLFFLRSSSSKLNTTTPTIHPTLKTKYTLQDHDSSSSSEYKFGHPSSKEMPNPCIVILTYNRPQSLLRTVNSLLSIEGITSYKVYISQDGKHKLTTNMIRQIMKNQAINNINHIHHEQKRSQHNLEPTAKLALHYKFMFDSIFVDRNHSHAIILEDDMIFSRDFLEYFASTVHLLNNPKNKLFCISSWNDYGQNFLEHDDKMLHKTDYFPGLGWMLKRGLWLDIRSIFPTDHWDHFMRSHFSNRLECIYPEISRNYNIGEMGSTMDKKWYNQYLRPMQFDKNSLVRFRDLDLSYLEVEKYESYMIDLFETKAKFVGIFPRDSNEIFAQLKQANIEKYGNCLLIAYDGYKWPLIARKFGLLENGHRTKHKNAIIIKKNGVMYIFANIRLCPYLKYNEDTIGLSESVKNENMQIVAGENGESCSTVCGKKDGMKCLNDHFEYVNDCIVLYEYFGCESGCLGGMIGEDVPNYVSKNKPGLYQKCLITDFQPLCGAKHPTTSRICPCA